MIKIVLIVAALAASIAMFSGSDDLPETYQAVDLTHDSYPEQVRSQTRALWRELQAVQHEFEFHRHGLYPDGPLGDWANRRKALQDEWEKYAAAYPEDAEENTSLGPAIVYVGVIGWDWSNTDGRGTKRTPELIAAVQTELDR